LWDNSLPSLLYFAFNPLNALLLLLGVGFTLYEFPCKPVLAAPDIVAAKNYMPILAADSSLSDGVAAQKSMPILATDFSLFNEVMDSLDSRYVDVIDKVCCRGC
jgi:hypothetical protein